MTAKPDQLAKRADALLEGAGQAIDWVRDVRGSAPSLDRDADGLIDKLRRTRNQSRSLGRAATRPVSIGVFGMSQAGKSYLISSLAQDESGALQTDVDGKRLHFIKHVNPPGSGKESTGLVTRFTRHGSDAPTGYPLELTLFSESDVVKILGNSFFNDFDRERVEFNTDPAYVREHIERFDKQKQPNLTGGLSEDEMVGILDYFDLRYSRSVDPLKGDFWPAAVEIAPRLTARARGEFLSLLWGGISEFTDLYVTLQESLQALSNARTVYVPVEALVVETDEGYEWASHSILNVDVLNRLGSDDDAPLRVLPILDGEVKSEVALKRSLLAALTAEMRFLLAEPPAEKVLESVDLLDFPGYRGRLQLASIEEVDKATPGESGQAVAKLLLRGRVAYLFERYTDDQEMNVLLMCARCDQQSDITTLAPVVTSWVHATQGRTPESRANRSQGLGWVITQIDRRLIIREDRSRTQELEDWKNMIHITMREHFARCEWFQEWSNGEPFDNTFLTRKTTEPVEIIAREDGVEQAIKPEYESRLGTLRDVFLEVDDVRGAIRDAGAAFDAALRANDGGMVRLAQYLTDVSDLATKLDRLDEQLTEMTDEVVEHRLGAYFNAEGEGAVEQKEAIADQVFEAVGNSADTVGELLAMLQVPSEQLRRLYLRADSADDDEAATPAAAPQPKRRSSLIKLPSAKPDAAAPAAASAAAPRAVAFAKAAMREWTRQLRDLSERADVQQFLGMSAEALQALTDELIMAAHRLALEEQLTQVLNRQEEKRSTKRSDIVDQQVLEARVVIADFINGLGLAGVPAAERPQRDGRRLFEPPRPIDSKSLPELSADEFPYTVNAIMDWLDAFRLLATNNAGHSAGREITPDQNRRLGEVLAAIRAAGSTASQ